MKRNFLVITLFLSGLFMIGSFGKSVNAMSDENVQAVSEIMPTPTTATDGDEFWTDSNRIKKSGNYVYHILSEKKKMITIRKICKVKEKISIPQKIDGYKVVGIGQSLYLPHELGIDETKYVHDDLDIDAGLPVVTSTSNIKEITIPSYISFVGENAFRDCKKLGKIKVVTRKNLLNLYDKAFYGCTSLKSLYLADKTKVNNRAFAQCGKISSVTIATDLISNTGDIFENTNIKTLKFEGEKKNYDISDHVNGSIDTIKVGKKVKKITMHSKLSSNISGVSSVKIGKMIVLSKNTKIEGWDKSYQKIGKVYTVKNSKAVSWAKRNKITYKTVNLKRLLALV